MRIACDIPGCRHTRGDRKGDVRPNNPETRWICQRHYMLVPKDWRRVWNRAFRRYEKGGERPLSDEGLALARIWLRCRRFIIEREAGIA